MPTPCWWKHLCSIRALVPVSFFLSLSLSLSLSFSGWSPGAQRLSEFTFLPGVLRPSWEGALHLHPIERAPEASVNRASPMLGALLAFCINQGISAFFSPLLSYRQLWTTRFQSIKGPQQLPTPVFLPGESPWSEEPGLPGQARAWWAMSPGGSQKIGHDWTTKQQQQTSLENKHIQYHSQLKSSHQWRKHSRSTIQSPK